MTHLDVQIYVTVGPIQIFISRTPLLDETLISNKFWVDQTFPLFLLCNTYLRTPLFD